MQADSRKDLTMREHMQKRQSKRNPAEPEAINPAGANVARAQELYKRGRRIISEISETPPDPKAEPMPPPEATHSRPEPDLLRAKIHQFSEQWAERTRASLLAMIQRSIPGLSALALQTVARFVDIVENDAGTDTPAESFITTIVDHHYAFGGLTPESEIHEIESPDGFRINFADLIDSTKRCIAIYPDVMKTNASGFRKGE